MASALDSGVVNQTLLDPMMVVDTFGTVAFGALSQLNVLGWIGLLDYNACLFKANG
jgi:hypothetical protein